MCGLMREVPNPLIIDINKGDADINVVLKDILALTKLNYNTCIFGDGMPITLKFADAVGEILTAGPIKDVPPLPFGHYIRADLKIRAHFNKRFLRASSI